MENKGKPAVPELAALKPGVLDRTLAELPDKPTPKQLAAAVKRLGLPGLESLEIRPRAVIDGDPCDPYEELLGLEKGPGQTIRKVILRVTPRKMGGCRETILRISTAFSGYGAYTVSFWKKASASEPDLFAGFFRDISAPRGSGSRPSANWHRTILFNREGHEGIPNAHLHWLLTPSLSVSTAYLANLTRFVHVANAYGVIVQVCLFSIHGVTGAGGVGPPNYFNFDVSDPGDARFRKFFKIGGPYQTFQTNMINAVTQALKDRPNVIWEVGNELRIPTAETSGYKKTDLTAWIDSVAKAIRLKAPGQLITCSTGGLAGGPGVPNEKPVNQLQSLDYAAFHQGQWQDNIPAAVNRAAGYSDRHVVIDTDGSNDTLVDTQVQSSATIAFSGALKYRASFDHKGGTPGPVPFEVYNPGWLDNPQIPNGKKPRQFLTALSNARAAAGV